MVPVTIGAGVALLLAGGGALISHAESKTNKVALSSLPVPVSVVAAKAEEFHAFRTFVGRIDPWISASLGPQFISAYVDTVLVRPGGVVRKGQVVATLDCRSENAMARAVEMQARALDEQQRALAHESSRVTSMLDGGFVSANEAEIKSAESSAKQAELLAQKAKLTGTSLEVNDCILRAPFDGDVATRTADPGAFVRPGSSIVSIVDRTTVRVAADVPESDFDNVAPGKHVTIHVYATHGDVEGAITRRAPAADPSTRTIHIEIDLEDPTRTMPVGTTAEIRVESGRPVPATAIPIAAATLRDTTATVFYIDGDTAHSRSFPILGEHQGAVYTDPVKLPAGTRIVTEGRALLTEGARVSAKSEAEGAR